ncbi:MAG: hypothetical protein JSV87_03565 [Candidatus Bathyarchaeota archaeon]|nr:MAG: hypothetical protein JSV87_03565 [Candidatus Bathyarchaeota archaeon]
MHKLGLDIAIPRRISYGRDFKETLRLCREVTKAFRGSEETLRCIQRVEECLKRVLDETN